MNLYVLYASMILAFSPGLMSRTIQKSISIDYVEEKVNESLFVYRRELVDGLLKESWTIDGKKVTKDDYDRAILETEMQERAQERAREHAARRARIEFQESATRSIYQKLIEHTITALETLAIKFERYNLAPHVITCSTTITCQEEFKHVTREAPSLLQGLLHNQPLSALVLQEAYEKYAEYPERLAQCFYDTVHHAINTVDDTKRLKELLMMIAEES